jgi:hypothetical protein
MKRVYAAQRFGCQRLFDGKCILSGKRMRPRVLISAPSPKYPLGKVRDRWGAISSGRARLRSPGPAEIRVIRVFFPKNKN